MEGSGFLPVGISVLCSVSRAPGKPAKCRERNPGRGTASGGSLGRSKKGFGKKKKKKKIRWTYLAMVIVPAGLQPKSPEELFCTAAAKGKYKEFPYFLGKTSEKGSGHRCSC